MADPASIGPYRVLRKLGQGGMGVVYLVQDPDTPRALALKLILESRSGDVALERFWREAEALGRIHHRNVVRVHQIGQIPQGTYMLMEAIEGGSLDQLVNRGPVAPREAARIVRELSDAIAAVHAQGILHRDIKPGNIILKPDGIPVLLDFGLIRDLSAERLTKTGATLGTLSYMSPEQTGGESTTKLGPPTDIYSLGVILFELLTSLRPFEEDSPAQLVAQKLYDEAPRVSSLCDVPAELDAICRVALAREPGRRYATAEELREDLDRFLAGRPPLALERTGRRGGLRWLAPVAVVALLAVGGVWTAQRPDATQPQATRAAVEDEAATLAEDARRLLAGSGLLAEKTGDVQALGDRLRELERMVQGAGGKQMRRARQRVGALEGLLSLTKGDTSGARAALTRLEALEPPLPSTYALRGAVAAVTSADDPEQALKDISRANARGIAPPELVGWRARAQYRAATTPAAAQRVLDDLQALTASRRLTREERCLRVLALVRTKEAEAASAALAELESPRDELRWAVALAHVELHLEKDPGRARTFLDGLPEQESPSPERARLAQRALQLAEPAIATLRTSRDRPLEDRMLDVCRLLKRLQPAQPLPQHLAEALVGAATGWSFAHYWSPGQAKDLAELIPERPELLKTLALMALVLRTVGERKRLLPIMRMAVKALPEGEAKLDLEVATCMTLAQIGQHADCMERVEDLLGRLKETSVLRADVLAARALVRRERGDPQAALKDIEAALGIRNEGRWTDGVFYFHRALILQDLGRWEPAVQEAARYLMNLPTGLAEMWNQPSAYILMWEHGRLDQPELVRETLAFTMKRGPAYPGWLVRLALLQLQAGEIDQAAANLAKAAPVFDGKGLRAHADEAAAVAQAVAAQGAAALPKLEALVTKLEELRGEGFRP